MSSRFTTHTLTVCLPTKDHRSFVNARRRLRRIMGRLAPDLAALCVHQLRGRDSGGLAEDYLAAVGWPMPAPRAGHGRVHGRQRARASSPRLSALPPLPADPGRN